VATALALAGVARACPEGESAWLGLCVPDGGPGQGEIENWTRQVPAALQDAAAKGLAAWLTSSRDAALDGARPIPPAIRARLTGYIDEAVMDAARFRVGEVGPLNLATIALGYGDATAVTLVDVIVFQTEQGAQDTALWAHELTHVGQFRSWGVAGFARRYVADPQAVEVPAYAAQSGYAAWAAGPHRT
jgi:hypothetical protein